MLNTRTNNGAPMTRSPIHDEMTRLFDDLFQGWAAPPPTATQRRTPCPAMNVQETPDQILVEAEIPGFTMEQIEVSLLGDQLTLAGDRARSAEQSDEREGETGERLRWLRRERRTERFERTITLPAPVKQESVTASLANGVLTITLPKVDAPRRVKIDVASG